MTKTITYSYRHPSSLTIDSGKEALLLAPFNEISPQPNQPFFWGTLTDPFTTARLLIALSDVVQSDFNLASRLHQIKDPIVTAGNEVLRFEGFSQCAGVYARVDIFPNGYDGEFLANGTTNVDFNQAMISALRAIGKRKKVMLSVGKNEVGLYHSSQKFIERKVPLPTKWIKGLSTVQIYLSKSDHVYHLNKPQAIKLFHGLPKGEIKEDYFLVKRGNQWAFSPFKSGSGICIGGIHRLHLLIPLLPFLESLDVYAHDKELSSTWQLNFDKMRLTFSISRNFWRGFSGEGAALSDLIEDVPTHWLNNLNRYAKANQVFNMTLLAIQEDISSKLLENATSQLAAMGLLGFDLPENHFFYRELPFKRHRILDMNPRLKTAIKLLKNNKVTIVTQHEARIEARVSGTHVHHTVLLEGEKFRCTCRWYGKYQGNRGLCKHILAVKKKIIID